MTAKVKPPKTWSEDHPGLEFLLMIGYFLLWPLGVGIFVEVINGRVFEEGFGSGLLFVLPVIALIAPLLKHRSRYYKAKKDAERNKVEAERQRKAEEFARARERKSEEFARAQEHKADVIARRDADSQDRPYYYKIGRHRNETLVLRYGIANISGKAALDRAHADQIQEFGEALPLLSSTRNRSSEADYIALRKIRPAGMIEKLSGRERASPGVYLVELSDFRNRNALAVIKKGTDYVKTFLPMKETWFDQNKALEDVVKGNSTMSLRDISHFHVIKTIN